MDYKHITIPTHFLQVSNTILLASDLAPIEKLLLSEIIWLQDNNEEHYQKQYCTASNFYFKAVFNIQERQVSRYIKHLLDLGYIRLRKYINGDFRHITYNYNKCFERDITLGLKKKQ